LATYRGNGHVIPHLDVMAASSSGSGAGPAFVVGMLGIDDKRGGNRGSDKRLHCSCRGGGTGPAFFVGLLDVDNKRGATGATRATGATSQGRNKVALSLSRCQGGKGSGTGLSFVVGLLGFKDKRGAATGNSGNCGLGPSRTQLACAPCAHSGKDV
jgi:hypothetical protein